MTYKRLPYGEKSALIIEGNDLRDGMIVAAELNGGELLTRTHEILEAEENAYFTLTALGQGGRNLIGEQLTGDEELTPRSEADIRTSVKQKLAGVSLIDCVRGSFARSQLEVAKHVHLSEDLMDRQTQVLQLYSEGMINKTIATRLSIHEAYVAHLRDDMFRKLGARSIFSAVTVGYLAGILPARV